MGKTKYNRAKEFLDGIKESRGDIISFDILKQEITIKIGADEERTVKPYLKLMEELGMIKEVGENVIII